MHAETDAIEAAWKALAVVLLASGGTRIEGGGFRGPKTQMSGYALSIAALSAGLMAMADNPDTPPHYATYLRRSAELISEARVE